MNSKKWNANVECWGRFEIELDGPANGNPFVDIKLKGVFTYRNRTVEADGFYDGNGKYRIRYMPDTLGEWKFTTISNHSSLNDISGSFTSTDPKQDNHGPVQVTEQTHFQYADGKPFYPFGTTAYAWNHQ
jgi:hypothetical protein